MMNLLLLIAAVATMTDGEVWNEGVEYYRSGDVTNALRVLKPLMLSKTHGPRAAEVVAKLEYERGNREEAAGAAQLALRASPDDARLNRNFTRAVDGLAQKREEKRIEAILKAAQGQDPGALLRGATYETRQLMKDSGTYRTNAAAKAVAMADRLSARAKKLGDSWLPVREVIAQSVTNEEQAATILAQLEAASKKTNQAAKEIGDLDPNGYATLSDVEHDFTRFLKMTAMPPAALDEDLIAQSNAWMDVEAFNGRDWQREALDYTRAFRAKFPAWARAYEQQAQSDTNKPPFTAEDQAKISALATELEKLQLECAEKALPDNQQKALSIIGEMRGLLPKDNNNNCGGQPQGQPNQDQQNQDKNKDNQNDNQQQNQDDKKQDQQQNQDQQNQDEQQEQEENQEEEKQAAEAEEKSEEKEDPEDKAIEALLQKAQERNDEHEADKKARMRKAPLPPNERDW